MQNYPSFLAVKRTRKAVVESQAAVEKSYFGAIYRKTIKNQQNMTKKPQICDEMTRWAPAARRGRRARLHGLENVKYDKSSRWRVRERVFS